MKNVYLLLVLVLGTVACVQDKRPIYGETEWQRQMNADFKDATKSPLKDKDRNSFTELEFFPYDSIYVVIADLKRTPNEKPFKMKTTTDRLPNYVKYGEISFDLKGKPHKLNIYQNLDMKHKSGYEDYLFLPFLDDTNGASTYGGGRYVESRIPSNDVIVIDFNEAFNPYCAYNEKYSCPIVPRANYVNTTIEAGVKAFSKH